MHKNLPDIEAFFRSQLDPNPETPSPEVWEAVNARLDKDDAQRYKRKFLALQKVVILLFLVLLFFIVYEMASVKFNRSNPSAQQEVQKEQSDKNKAVPHLNSIRLDNENAASINKHKAAKRLEKATNSFSIPGIYVKKNPEVIPADNFKGSKEKKGAPTQPAITYKVNTKRQTPSTLTNKKYGTMASSRSYGKQRTYIGDQNNLMKPLPVAVSFSNTIFSPNPDLVKGTQPILNNKLKDRITEKSQKRSIQPKGPFFKPAWSITAYGINEWTQYKLEDDDLINSNNPQEDDREDIQQREAHELSFSGGLLATYKFKKCLALQSGIILYNSIINISPQTIYATKDVSGNIAYKYNISSGYAFVKPGFNQSPSIGDSLTTAQGQHRLQYLSIPVLFRHNWEGSKFSVSPGVGLSVNFLTHASIRTEIEDAMNQEWVTTSRLKGIKSAYIDFMLNGVAQYKITGKWEVSLLPSFRHAIMPITKKNVVKTYPYSIGLGAGLTYKF